MDYKKFVQELLNDLVKADYSMEKDYSSVVESLRNHLESETNPSECGLLLAEYDSQLKAFPGDKVSRNCYTAAKRMRDDIDIKDKQLKLISHARSILGGLEDTQMEPDDIESGFSCFDIAESE